jgi:hypothetical protein
VIFIKGFVENFYPVLIISISLHPNVSPIWKYIEDSDNEIEAKISIHPDPMWCYCLDLFILYFHATTGLSICQKKKNEIKKTPANNVGFPVHHITFFCLISTNNIFFMVCIFTDIFLVYLFFSFLLFFAV